MDKNELQNMSSELSSTNMIIRVLTQDIIAIKSFKIVKDIAFSSIPLVTLQEKSIDANGLINRINGLKNERNLVLGCNPRNHPKVGFLTASQDFKVELNNNLDNG